MQYSQYTNYTFNQLCEQIERLIKLSADSHIFIEDDAVYMVKGSSLYKAFDNDTFEIIGSSDAGCPVDVPERVTDYLYCSQ